MSGEISLEPWDDRAPALERAAITPEMKAHLGGVETGFAYPPGHRITSHDWRYDLRADPSWPG
jgi:hypothetical protein